MSSSNNAEKKAEEMRAEELAAAAAAAKAAEKEFDWPAGFEEMAQRVRLEFEHVAMYKQQFVQKMTAAGQQQQQQQQLEQQEQQTVEQMDVKTIEFLQVQQAHQEIFGHAMTNVELDFQALHAAILSSTEASASTSSGDLEEDESENEHTLTPDQTDKTEAEKAHKGSQGSSTAQAIGKLVTTRPTSAPPAVPPKPKTKSKTGASRTQVSAPVATISSSAGLFESLIYWRDVKQTALVFGIGLLTILAISWFSMISVFAHLAFMLWSGTVSFRIYKSCMQAVQNPLVERFPFREFLELDFTLSQERVVELAGAAVGHLNSLTANLRRLYLVEDLQASIKFGFVLYLLTYIGAWFNGMTLVILAFIALFTVPKIYEDNRQSIDGHLIFMQSKFLNITATIKAFVPLMCKKPTATANAAERVESENKEE